MQITQRTLVFFFSCAFNPIFWNIIARNEYRNSTLTKLFGNSKYAGCYFLAFCIFTLGLLRDYLYKVALEDFPVSPVLDSQLVELLAYLLVGVGNVLVLTSMWKLGITGTYLGDYFGILMKTRVTSFPFNVMENPMYNGSTMVFLGTGLYYKKIEGIYLSLYVFVVYQLALMYEGYCFIAILDSRPFTSKIYANKGKKTKSK